MPEAKNVAFIRCSDLTVFILFATNKASCLFSYHDLICFAFTVYNILDAQV